MMSCSMNVKPMPSAGSENFKSASAARNDDYLDFPPDYNFAAEVLAKACDTQKGARAVVVKQEEADGEEDAKACQPKVYKRS